MRLANLNPRTWFAKQTTAAVPLATGVPATEVPQAPAPLTTKASTTEPFVIMSIASTAVWTPRNYKQLAEEAYTRNPVAFKCIREIATSAAQAVLVVKERRGSDLMEAPTSPLAQLLKRPNPGQGLATFLEATTSFYYLSGNAYLEGVKGVLTNPPRELYTLRPDRMSIDLNQVSATIRGYTYKVGSGEKTWKLEDDLIRHIKSFHPTNDWYGLSPIEPAAYDIDIHNTTLQWNKALLDNGAKPSGALVYAPKRDVDPSTLGEEQYVRLKQEVEEKFAGKVNAGKPMLLDGGLMWVPFSFSPAEMDYENSKNSTARDIAMAMGVPAQLLGIPGDNTYNNMAEARLALWEQTVLPWLGLLISELNAWLAPQFGDFVIELDEDQIPALAIKRQAQWDKVAGAPHLTLNEKREATGYEPLGQGGDDVLVAANLVPVGSVDDSTEPEGDAA